MAEQIEIRRLTSTELQDQLDALAAVLADCVAGGASVSYMWPFSHEQARSAFEVVAAEVEQGRRLVLVAFADGNLVGTVQVILALPPNQPHRGEIAKLLVHRSARRRGIARLLMEGAEAEARAEGQDAAGAGHGDRRRRRASLRATRLDEGRRGPRLRALPGRATLRHDHLLEVSLNENPGNPESKENPQWHTRS